MRDDKKGPQLKTPGQWPMPALVDGFIVMFYAVTWLTLGVCVLGAISSAPDGDSGFWLPVMLYGLLLLSFVALNWRRFRRKGGAWNDLFWGYNDQLVEQLAFILLDFALVAWLSTLNPFFITMYFVLFGHTWGMLHWNGRLAAALMVAEILVQFYVLGILPALLGGQGLPDQFWAWAFSICSCLIYAFMIMRLIRSRIESEILIEELQATQRRLEEALIHEKEAAVLRERDRMAREMHDVLGHALVLVAVKIEAAQRLQAVDLNRANAELEATKELVRQSMADLRTSLAELRSPMLEPGAQPLGAALQTWVEKTAREGDFAIQCTFEAETDTLPMPIQDALWRVGREAVLNVVKHARAQHVELHLFRKEDAVFLSVADDGIGIPHLAEGQARLEVEGHYGIRGMRERLEALGGHLAIRPARDGQGTLVLASVPLPPPEPPPAQRIRDRRAPVRSLLFRREQRP